MRRWLLIFFALLLPLQFAWSGASAYCQHEADGAQARHFGHHFHAHQGDAGTASAGKLSVDADCASCHTAGSSVIASHLSVPAHSASSGLARPMTARLFSSALARAPDRPQWLRLV